MNKKMLIRNFSVSISLSIVFICLSLFPIPAHAEKFPEPDPPKIDLYPTEQPIPSSQFEKAPSQTPPGAEWSYHKTPDNAHPDGNEQQMIWLMNRARENPAAEGVWLATMDDSDVAGARAFFNVDLAVLQNELAAIAVKPPAAFDSRLYYAALAHSQDLIARDAQDHNNQFDRIDNQGFSYLSGRGNVFSYAKSALYAHAGFNIDWGPGDNTGMQPGRGHRLAIMSIDGDYTNVGIAVVAESDPNTAVGPLVVTGNYVKANTNMSGHYNRFLVGTVWMDSNCNSTYDSGEGISGVTVMPDHGTYYAVTSNSGGYAIPLTSSGTYQVTFSGSSISCNFVRPVSAAGESVLLDLNIDSDCDGTPDCSDVEPSEIYYFPHIASDGTWETEIGIINTDSQSISGDLKAYNNSGQEISSTSITLAANARREIVVGDELPNPSSIGYITFETDSPSVKGYLKFYINGKYRVAIPAASEVNAGDIYVSHIASDVNWTTGISILNTTSSSITLTIEFDNGATQTITIAGNEHRAFTVRELFGNVMQPGINSAVIKNGNGIVGLEIFGTTAASGLNYLSGILLKDETTTIIYYPHVASGSTWATGIVAYNPSMTINNLTITPYNESGALLSPRVQSLAGREKYIGTPESLKLPDGTAWFSIEATNPITGFELFSTTDGNQLGGYTGVGISGTSGVFAKIEKDGGTGIAFVNIENTSATVSITAYDDSGNVVAMETFDLSAHEKIVDVPSKLFSQVITTATYIAYSSSGNVVGFQLNVSSDNMMLDALPGM